MGNSNSRELNDEKPTYTKHAENCESIIFQGFRSTMEDALCVRIGQDAWLGVFDGHGGDSCVNYVSSKLIDNLISTDLSESQIIKQFILTEKAFSFACESSPREIVSEAGLYIRSPKRSSGCCALVANLKSNILTLAHVGDCCAILISNDGSFTKLIEEHRPNDKGEYERINAAGLSVISDRVNGELAVSRAFGDYEYKGFPESEFMQAVTCVPSIVQIPIRPSDKYLVLCTDGLSDAIDPQDIVKRIDSLESLMKDAYEESKDNVTIIKYILN